MLLSTSYLPPVWYMAGIANSHQITIDVCEHFVKQTIRNRCHILSPNGVQTLIIPITHSNRTNSPVKDIRISNQQMWQRQHWRSLDAAYRRSAFFEFYMDDLAPLYNRQFDFLLDFNMELLNLVTGFYKLKPKIEFTENYNPANDEKSANILSLCNLGVPNQIVHTKSYPQVFSYKNGFVPGLSGIDLLFNMGPTSINYLTA